MHYREYVGVGAVSLGVFIILMAVLFGSTRPVGKLVLGGDELFKDKVETYMAHSSYEAQLIDDQTFVCASDVLGYDDRYAYANVLCQGYRENAGVIEKWTGFRTLARFEFVGPAYLIKGHDEPMDGTYASDMKRLFPKHIRDLERAPYANGGTDLSAEADAKIPYSID